MDNAENKVLLAEHTPPPGLTTDASKRAWLARETRLANMSIEMFNFIYAHNPEARELYTHFPDADPADVSDCMWRLLDELFIEVNAENKLAVIGTDSIEH